MYTLITVFGVTAVVWYKYRRSISQKFFATVFSIFTVYYNRCVDRHKRELFEKLTEFDRENRRKHGRNSKILELGVGSGANLKYYPSTNIDYSCVEPNSYFKPFFAFNLCKYPNINLDTWVDGVGEDLSSFPDSSFDVVVVTLVFCSVTDVQKVLQEILRVLRPGGRFFFIEHVLDKPGTLIHRIQKFAAPLWFMLTEGCYIDRHPAQLIRSAGFESVEIGEFCARNLCFLAPFVCPHIIGHSVK